MAHYEPHHQDLRCLQSQLHVFSSLVLKELTGHLLVFWLFWVILSHQELSKLRLDVIDVCTHETHVFRTRTKQNKCSTQNNQIFNNNTHFFTILQFGIDKWTPQGKYQAILFALFVTRRKNVIVFFDREAILKQ